MAQFQALDTTPGGAHHRETSHVAGNNMLRGEQSRIGQRIQTIL